MVNKQFCRVRMFVNDLQTYKPCRDVCNQSDLQTYEPAEMLVNLTGLHTSLQGSYVCKSVRFTTIRDVWLHCLTNWESHRTSLLPMFHKMSRQPLWWKVFVGKKLSWISFLSKFTGAWENAPVCHSYLNLLASDDPDKAVFCCLCTFLSFSDRTARKIWVSSKLPAFHSSDMWAFIVCMLGSMGVKE